MYTCSFSCQVFLSEALTRLLHGGSCADDAEIQAQLEQDRNFGSFYDRQSSFYIGFHLSLSCSTTQIIQTATTWSFIAAFILAGLIQAAMLRQTLATYKNQLQRLHKGDRRFLPDANLPVSSSIANGLSFGGFLIAYAIAGWIIHSIVIIVVFLLITFLIVLPLPVDGWYCGSPCLFLSLAC